MVQYVVAAGVTRVFSELSETTRAYLDKHARLICHKPGPYCADGLPAEVRTPIAAVHVRRGDSCDRERREPGPFNSMFAFDPKKGKLDRVGFRCSEIAIHI